MNSRQDRRISGGHLTCSSADRGQQVAAAHPIGAACGMPCASSHNNPSSATCAMLG